ncbi:MAG: hypothetical protein JWP42_4214 [Pseudomonas sp.]|nr:hypothetical protein [Pseudomonas sp.]
MAGIDEQLSQRPHCWGAQRHESDQSPMPLTRGTSPAEAWPARLSTQIANAQAQTQADGEGDAPNSMRTISGQFPNRTGTTEHPNPRETMSSCPSTL